MKKLFSLCFVCLLAVSALAQRAAVMDFNAGADVSETDVNGLACVFTSYFRPAGYDVIDCAEMEDILAAQQVQRSTLTKNQMLRIGKLLNLSEYVVGEVSVDMGQYHVEVQIVDVEDGSIVASEESTFLGTAYIEGMQILAHKLAAQIAICGAPTPCEQALAQLQSQDTDQSLNISLTDLVSGRKIASDDVKIFINTNEVEYSRNDNNYTIVDAEQYYNSTFTIAIVYEGYKRFTIQDTDVATIASKTYSLSTVGTATEIYMDWSNRDSTSPLGTHDVDTHVKVYDHNNRYITTIYFGNKQFKNEDISIKLNRDDTSSSPEHGETITINYLSENGKKYTFYYFLHDYRSWGGTVKTNIFKNCGTYITYQNKQGETIQILPETINKPVNLWHIFSIRNDKCTIKDVQGVIGDPNFDTSNWRFRGN